MEKIVQNSGQVEIRAGRSTFEGLRDTLQQFLEERRLAEQRVLDIQSEIVETARALQLLMSTNEQVSVHPVQTSEQTTLSPDDIRRMISEYSALQRASESPKLITINFDVVSSLFWKYILPFAIMMVILWLIVSAWSKNDGNDDAARLPSLISTAQACVLGSQVQERVQERREWRQEVWQSVAAPIQEMEEVDELSAIQVAIADLQEALTELKASKNDAQLVDTVTNKWHWLVEAFSAAQETAEEELRTQTPETETLCVDGECTAQSAPAFHTQARIIQRPRLFQRFR